MEEEKTDYFNELILTFSNRKSFFSSKKIERFVVFSTFLIITIIYLGLNLKTIKPIEFIEVIGLWLTYGGWNTYQSYRDKKLDIHQNAKQTNTI